MKKVDMSITDGEWEIMESVWQADDQTPAEILARIEVGNRSHRTLRTLLVRLVEKGAVSVRVDGSKHLYSASVSRNECIRSVAVSFSKRFFSGNLKSLLLHFVEDQSLTTSEIDELRARLATLASSSDDKTQREKAGGTEKRSRKASVKNSTQRVSKKVPSKNSILKAKRSTKGNRNDK